LSTYVQPVLEFGELVAAMRAFGKSTYSEPLSRITLERLLLDEPELLCCFPHPDAWLELLHAQMRPLVRLRESAQMRRAHGILFNFGIASEQQRRFVEILTKDGRFSGLAAFPLSSPHALIAVSIVNSFSLAELGQADVYREALKSVRSTAPLPPGVSIDAMLEGPNAWDPPQPQRRLRDTVVAGASLGLLDRARWAEEPNHQSFEARVEAAVESYESAPGLVEILEKRLRELEESEDLQGRQESQELVVGFLTAHQAVLSSEDLSALKELVLRLAPIR
jgi:hypothetical protein